MVAANSSVAREGYPKLDLKPCATQSLFIPFGTIYKTHPLTLLHKVDQVTYSSGPFTVASSWRAAWQVLLASVKLLSWDQMKLGSQNDAHGLALDDSNYL